MRYFLQSLDQGGFPFELEVFSKKEYRKTKAKLKRKGHTDFFLAEGWNDLNEMYQTLEAEGLYESESI